MDLTGMSHFFKIEIDTAEEFPTHENEEVESAPFVDEGEGYHCDHTESVTLANCHQMKHQIKQEADDGVARVSDCGNEPDLNIKQEPSVSITSGVITSTSVNCVIRPDPKLKQEPEVDFRPWGKLKDDVRVEFHTVAESNDERGSSPHSHKAGVKRKIPVKSKQKSISLEVKRKILTDIDSGVKNSVAARKYGCSPSTISTVVKQREKFEQASFAPGRKRLRVGASSTDKGRELDDALFVWYKQACSSGVTISGPILLLRAQKIAEEIGMGDFKPSHGWLHRFKKRKGIRFRVIVTEPGSVARRKMVHSMPSAKDPTSDRRTSVKDPANDRRTSVKDPASDRRTSVKDPANDRGTSAKEPANDRMKMVHSMSSTQDSANDNVSDEDDSSAPGLPTLSAARKAVETLNLFFQSEASSGTAECLKKLADIQDYISKRKLALMRQRKTCPNKLT